MIDAAALRSRIDLLDLIGKDTALKWVASTGGGEYAGGCPRCGGVDRLKVQPNARPGRWWCRGCSPTEQWGDALDWYRAMHGLTFPQALAALGGDLALPPSRSSSPRPRSPEPPPEPTPAWREQAEATVREATARLWSSDGDRARQYLTRRGLHDETIQAAELGVINPGTREAGILIPWREAGALTHVNVRRAVGEPRYKALPGGHPGLFGVDDLAGHPAVLLLEAEFDALLVWQEAGDQVDAAALGTTKRSLPPAIRSRLAGYEALLVAYDSDPPGDTAAAHLVTLSKSSRRVTVPHGKDPGEYYAQGGDLRAWATTEAIVARLIGDGWPEAEARTLAEAPPYHDPERSTP